MQILSYLLNANGNLSGTPGKGKRDFWGEEQKGKTVNVHFLLFGMECGSAAAGSCVSKKGHLRAGNKNYFLILKINFFMNSQ